MLLLQTLRQIHRRNLTTCAFGYALSFLGATTFFGQTSSSSQVSLNIFAVGFTDIANSSARLVFTTTQPTSARITVLDQKAQVIGTVLSSLDEIHAVPLSGLKPDTHYTVRIHCTNSSGVSADQSTTITPHLRPASVHVWPGYTIFSTTVSGDNPNTLDLLADSGARMVRVEVSWDGVFPHRGEINRDYLDRAVNRITAFKAHGLEPLVVLDYSVAWAMPNTSTTMTWRNPNFGPPDDLADWETYVRTVVTALRGTARYYEIWNEPDAGYLATGRFVERPDMPPPIGRPPFKDNWQYWIGDRYAPMILSVRRVMDKLQPGAILMNGGWNRDYSGQRGDLLLERGVAPYIDDYAYHVYTHAPVSFARWYKEVDGGFRVNIDRIFAKNNVALPLAVTEWGTPAWEHPEAGKGFATFSDSQLFYVKTTFYFLSMERFEILSQFSFGVGPVTRDHDPLFFMLVNETPSGHLDPTPSYTSFRWLARTFSNMPYRAIHVETGSAPHTHVYAIQLRSSHEIYLAAWQDGEVNDAGAITAVSASKIAAVVSDVPVGTYHASVLDITGKTLSESTVSAHGTLHLDLPLPAATATAESGVYLLRITPAISR